jgi:hypothetical protein
MPVVSGAISDNTTSNCLSTSISPSELISKISFLNHAVLLGRLFYHKPNGSTMVLFFTDREKNTQLESRQYFTQVFYSLSLLV